MKPGDLVVRINDTPTINLTHQEVHDLIISAGNNFVMGIRRPEEEVPLHISESNHTDEKILNDVTDQSTLLLEERPIQTPESQAFSEMSEMTINSFSDTQSEAKSTATDEHIAEVLSGEAEVLKDHNVIG